MNFYSILLSAKYWLKEWGWGMVAAFSSYALLLSAQPPYHTPESAYVFLLPSLIWFSFKPKISKVLVCYTLAGFVYYICLIGWIRHITFGGMLMASLLLSLYTIPWFLTAKYFLFLGVSRSFGKRCLYLLFLPCLWVTIEWLRSQFTLGFPWCPLSITQWERPMILQSSAWVGAWGVSFFLVFFNLCIGSYVHHLLVRRRDAQAPSFFNVCPDFYLGIGLFCLMVTPFLLEMYRVDPKEEISKVRVGVCQPYLQDKWVQGNASLHKDKLSGQTKLLSSMSPDFVVWPEASTPYALNLDSNWVKELVEETNTTLLLGAVVKEDFYSYNTVAKVSPKHGIDPLWYAKRKLVPFGEYIPFPFNFFSALTRFVGPVGNFTSGDTFCPISLSLPNGKNLKIGPLICYEDIFPSLARDAAISETDLLFVTTNDAWFGEEGCAEQHAAHSVLRAVETGLPVLRCGNAGWSGWIDHLGRKRDVLRDEHGSIYFEGAGVIELQIQRRAVTFYSSTGDFFPIACLVCFIFLILVISWKRKLPSEV
ncbi:MAG: apolipoprotein N-acyltransferase [Opitutales bacterium]|nr:apolipoprotein N-acyltransferase [Opitutales bacterium]